MHAYYECILRMHALPSMHACEIAQVFCGNSLAMRRLSLQQWPGKWRAVDSDPRDRRDCGPGWRARLGRVRHRALDHHTCMSSTVTVCPSHDTACRVHDLVLLHTDDIVHSALDLLAKVWYLPLVHSTAADERSSKRIPCCLITWIQLPRAMELRGSLKLLSCRFRMLPVGMSRTKARLGKATLLRDLDFRDPVSALHAEHDELDQTSQEISHWKTQKHRWTQGGFLYAI